MIPLQQVTKNIIDLSESEAFVAHYNKKDSWAKYILDKEINNGKWYDELLSQIPDDGVIIDAGANVGLFTLYLSGKNRKFYCIEPTHYHIRVMVELFEKFHIDATIYKGVLYKEDGEVGLFEEKGNSTMNRIGNGSRVNAVTLKTFLANNKLEKVDFLKLDIEGGEWAVIMEDPTIEEPLKKCSVVFIETHSGWWGGGKESDLIAKMKSFGFKHKAGKREMSHYFVRE